MDEPLQYHYVPITGGTDPEIDAIGICIEVLRQLEPEAKRRALCYLWERHIGPCATHSAGAEP